MTEKYMSLASKAVRIDRLEASLREMIDVVCQADWTAFSLADRSKLDRARALVGSQADGDGNG